MRRKKGFTLVELLVTIVLLGIVGAIVIYNMTSVTTSSKETEYERYIAAVKSAAAVYADLNPDAFNDLYVSKSYIYIKAGDLIKDGTLDENTINPYTGEKIGFNEIIKANLDSKSGALTFIYPLDEKKEETFLVALSDYVVWGEPYDCMQGAGSYELALSEENGDLIMLNNPENIKKYKFECSMPKNFNPTESGNYDITYNWITSSGTRKSSTRTLRVLAKVRPELDVKTNKGAAFDPRDGANIFTPTVDATCTDWTYLTYKPVMNGADPESTLYKISKQSISPKPGKVIPVVDYNQNYEKVYTADDGKVTYIIETRVYGHYKKDYYYDEKNKVSIHQELVVDRCLVSGASTVWDLERDYFVKDTYSPVGVQSYEYYVVEAGGKKPANGRLPETQHLVDRNKNFVTAKQATQCGISLKKVNSNTCENVNKNYDKVYFRAINKNGYVGAWTEYVNAYLTTSLTNIMNTKRSTTTCKDACQNNSAPFGTKSSLNGLSCYYCDKSVYVKYGNRIYVVLGMFDNGEILVATDTPATNRNVALTEIKYKTWYITTCDGLYSTGFKYTSPAFSNLKSELANFVATLPDNNIHIVPKVNWYASVGDEDVGQLPDLGIYRQGSAAQAAWDRWNAQLAKSNRIEEYFSQAGTPTKEEFEAVFQDALSDDKPYWLATTFKNTFPIRVSHGDSTTVSDTHFYAVQPYKTKASEDYTADKNSANTVTEWQRECSHSNKYNNVCNTTPAKYAYVGDKAYVKAMIRFNRATICDGDGSKSNPFVISVK